MQRTIFEPEHELFRESFQHFVDTEITPYHEEWGRAGKVDKAMFREAGKRGFLGWPFPRSTVAGVSTISDTTRSSMRS